MSTAQQGMADNLTIKKLEYEGSLPTPGDAPCDWQVVSNDGEQLEAVHYRGAFYKGPVAPFMAVFE